MQEGTTSTLQPRTITLEDIKKASRLILEKEEKELPKGLHWFTKLMGKFGWHRKYEIIFIDTSRFNFLPYQPIQIDKK